jgi:hypothetical protein
MKKFPCADLGCIDKPAIIIDCKGWILIWYLPGILLLPEQVRIFGCLLRRRMTFFFSSGRHAECDDVYLSSNGEKCQREMWEKENKLESQQKKLQDQRKKTASWNRDIFTRLVCTGSTRKSIL